MKRILVLQCVLFAALVVRSQITTPIIKANFGVDADLRANYFSGALQPGNDDWYNFPGTAGAGEFVIDTNGAAYILSRYATDIPFRRTTFARSMRFPAYAVINSRTLLDAIFVRDFHGDDSTVFASGGNKNGDNPSDWVTPVSQGIPDKNDILDMLVHVRRAGPNGSDSLWMMGGMSLDNTTGNRYFDFEMYQTDLYYDRPALRFRGSGPDAGHTSWEFDAAGNVTKAGDIIFSAEYQSSSLTFIEARIWVHQSKLLITPAAFKWSGTFDGASAGAVYGYASIQPKAGGTYYTGLQCGNNTWGGPFGIVLQNDALASDYAGKQFVEFSVNLTKLGLDPLTVLGGDPCGMPFRRILVKTRASASFTAELKDFVAPFAFFDPPKAQVQSETPFMCAGSVVHINVTNPLSTSSYTWSTANGNIVGSASGTAITVDTPGIYVVTQHLLSGCGVYATDTVQILPFGSCSVLSPSATHLSGEISGRNAFLKWVIYSDTHGQDFIVERSIDGIHFIAVGEVKAQPMGETAKVYTFNDYLQEPLSQHVFYRVRLSSGAGFSNTIRLRLPLQQTRISVHPNPARDQLAIEVPGIDAREVIIEMFDVSGRSACKVRKRINAGENTVLLSEPARLKPGLYLISVIYGQEVFQSRLVVVR